MSVLMCCFSIVVFLGGILLCNRIIVLTCLLATLARIEGVHTGRRELGDLMSLMAESKLQVGSMPGPPFSKEASFGGPDQLVDNLLTEREAELTLEARWNMADL